MVVGQGTREDAADATFNHDYDDTDRLTLGRSVRQRTIDANVRTQRLGRGCR